MQRRPRRHVPKLNQTTVLRIRHQSFAVGPPDIIHKCWEAGRLPDPRCAIDLDSRPVLLDMCKLVHPLVAGFLAENTPADVVWQ